MRLRVLNNYILVRPDQNEWVDADPEIARILKEGVIQIPDKYKGWFEKAAMRGEIVSFGEKCYYKHHPGDRIVFARFCGNKINWNNEALLLMTEIDLLAKEENE